MERPKCAAASGVAADVLACLPLVKHKMASGRIETGQNKGAGKIKKFKLEGFFPNEDSVLIEVVKCSTNEKPSLGKYGCQSKKSELCAESALPHEGVASVSRHERAAVSKNERRSASEECNVVLIFKSTLKKTFLKAESLANHEYMLPAMKWSSEGHVSACFHSENQLFENNNLVTDLEYEEENIFK
ncbi:hypothetical protein NDU88_006709 [Pleurodeles waltl]|uniref:Uncharacterized protein n=1 Tax=Pleurodeles waltl TaxID=8319 RepID=A0AAV7U173_PLEWA|nr:hypothetical protein NDU88_006709 [Pleurodeles waltl]